MIPNDLLDQWQTGLADGSIVPYLGPGVLADVTSLADGRPMPATSERADPGDERRSPDGAEADVRVSARGDERRTEARQERRHALSRHHLWRHALDALGSARLAHAASPALCDRHQPRHAAARFLGGDPAPPGARLRRLSGTDYRFKLYVSDGSSYRAIAPEEADATLPVLFKPMGAPRPQPSYIASDADYVDYITELMGGFAVPAFVKTLRRGKRYLLLGMRLNRDTERMVLSDLIHDAAGEPAGWALIAEANDKERRFCKRLGIAIIDCDATALVAETAHS
jgi:hypothetical protein